MSSSMGDRLLESAATFSFPRRAGSTGDRRAIGLLAASLGELGLDVELEDFSYDLRPVEKILRRTLLSGAGLAVLAGWLVDGHAIWSLAVTSVLVCGGGMLLGWSPWLENLYRRDGPTRTANVVGRRRVSGPRRRLILMAHHDSKSQSLALPGRMAATFGSAAGILGVVVGAGLELAGNGGGRVPIGLIAGVVAGFSLAALATMRSGNESPGGVDNAGSMAIVLELASRIAVFPSDLQVEFLFTGAEEDHMVGAMRWLDRHAGELPPDSTMCLNFDGAGSPGRTVLIARYGSGRRFAPELERRAVGVADEIGVPIRRIVMAPAVGIDAIPFAHRGIECLTISSGSLGRATCAVHSAGDVAENLDPGTMVRIVDYAEALIRRF